MEVILKQDFPALGYVGDRVKVRRGYARNFLIPRGIAAEIGSRHARVIGHLVAGINAHKAKLKTEADELAGRLSGAKLDFTLKIGSQGKSFGSVSLRDIELALEQQGFKIDRRQLRLPEQIKGGGQFSLLVKLHSEVTATLPINVTVERPQVVKEAQAEGEAGQEARGKRKRTPKSKHTDAEEEQTTSEQKSDEPSA